MLLVLPHICGPIQMFVTFFRIMKAFARHKRKIYWKQKILNASRKGGIVFDETGKKTEIDGILCVDLGKNNRIVVNSGINIFKKASLLITVCGDNNTVTVSNITISDKLVITIGTHATPANNVHINIGANSGFCSTFIEALNSNNSISVGTDCMFSDNVYIYNTDGHPIYSLKTNEIINKVKDLKIGNHVWVAKNATILKNTFIPDGCIVARNAVVSGNKFQETNCVIAGNPACVKKRGIYWKDSDIEYIKNPPPCVR